MAETLVLTSAAATAFDLTGLADFTAVKGMFGFGHSGVNFVEDYAPDQHGSFLASVTLNPRDLSIPLIYQKSTRQQFIDLRRQLVKELSPLAGAGYLTYTDPSGAARKLTELYILGGLEGNTSQDANGVVWQKAVLRARALDPLYYNTVVQNETFAKTAASGNFLGNPFLPIKLADSALFGSKTINNPGDVTAYPVWTITGAFTTMSLINETTGKTLSLTYNLGASQEISIDCRVRRSQTPNGKKVLQGTTDLFSNLTAWEFWGLEPGNNTVRIEASNTDGNTAFELDFYPPYLGQ